MTTNECHKCGNFIEFPDHGVGESIQCPLCGTRVLLTDGPKTLPAPPPLPGAPSDMPPSVDSLAAAEAAPALEIIAALKHSGPASDLLQPATIKSHAGPKRVMLYAGGAMLMATVFATILFMTKVRPGGADAELKHTLAVNQIAQDAVAAKVPTGLFGAKWLMSSNEVLAAAPNAKMASAGVLAESRNVYDRPATVSYHFKDDALLMMKATFVNPSNPLEFQQTQTRLSADYGRMPKAVATNGFALISQKRVSHFVVQHLLKASNSLEQIVLYVRGGGNPATMPDLPPPKPPK